MLTAYQINFTESLSNDFYSALIRGLPVHLLLTAQLSPHHRRIARDCLPQRHMLGHIVSWMLEIRVHVLNFSSFSVIACSFGRCPYWFELVFLGIIWIMDLVGAVIITVRRFHTL